MMSPLFSITGQPSADPAGVYLVSSGEGGLRNVTKKQWVSHLLSISAVVDPVI